MKNIKRYKKLISLMLALMFIFNLTGTVPMNVFAENMKTYVHDGYIIDYVISGEWTGNQNIQVSIKNTSSEVMSNWAVGYNAGGIINGLWNAQVYGQQENEYILKNASYNSDIAPGATANFGYTLSGDDLKITSDVIIVSKRVDILDEFNVYFNVTGDYGNTYQANMVIENNSAAPIEAW